MDALPGAEPALELSQTALKPGDNALIKDFQGAATYLLASGRRMV
jgi:23S rRNA U2552 (ribose-2'-O)-methylase RlmE/FtsJ